MRHATVLLCALGCAALTAPAHSFCGFYVASGNAKLFNHASQVVLVRDGDRTVITMASDFKGEPKAFAVVIPVPTVITKEQVHIGDSSMVAHLDAYSAPRLVEYFDPNPCEAARSLQFRADKASRQAITAGIMVSEERALGVHIEARYTVGEYDILILSAENSRGLEAWLKQNGYRIP